MQIYEQIFTKEKMIQCQFYDTSFHPDYLGAEYQAGYELITALTYDREYTSSMLSKLVRSYIEYLENPTDKKRSSYEKIIYDIDDYCIYLHELSIVIITLIKDVHPNYLLSNRRMVAHHFSVNAVKEMLNELDEIHNLNHITDKVYLPFWDHTVHNLLDWFDSYTQNIKSDLWTIITSKENYTGLNRLNILDMDRVNYYTAIKWSTRISSGLKNPDHSKLIFSSQQNDEIPNVMRAMSIWTTETLMYYDLILSLEKNIPIKICKNCNMPFIPAGRNDTIYCNRITPGFKSNCSKIGAQKNHIKKLSAIENEFFATHRRYYTRTYRNPAIKSKFESWKISAKEKLKAYRNGEITAEEFKNWFLDDKWTKLDNL